MPKTLNSSNAVYARSTNLESKKDYVRCDKCRLKFPRTAIGSMDLKGHRGGGTCYRRQVERGMHKSAVSQPPTKAGDCVLSYKFRSSVNDRSPVTTSTPVSVLPSANAPQHKHDYPAERGADGRWTKKCDLCEQTIGLGLSLMGNCFETHRNSGGCQRAQVALRTQSKEQEKEQEENPKGLMKFFTRTSSQSSEGASSSKIKSLHKAKANRMTVPSPSAEEKNKGVAKSKTTSDRKPSDADRTTLARDIRRALADIPVEFKRKNIEEDGYPEKKKKRKDFY